MTTDPDRLPHPFFRPESRHSGARIQPPQLRALRESAEPPVLLDVRTAREREYSHLPGDIHIPLSTLADRWGELPRRRPIVVYDHLGAHALRAAEFLGIQGFVGVAALDGGIDGYALLADPTVPRYRTDERGNGVYLHQLPRPDTGCLAYFVGDISSRDAILIDPGLDVDPYLALLKKGSWRLGAIVETHTHADHLAGHAALHAKTDAPIYVGRLSPALYPHRSVGEGESIPFGSQELIVLETPGHTPDHVTLTMRDTVFTGDTLLIGSCGRTDLGEGSSDLLYESLTEKLLKLPDATEVYPAHFGPHHALVDRWVSSMGFERATNEALLQANREAFLRYMTEGWPPKPVDFDQIVDANLAP